MVIRQYCLIGSIRNTIILYYNWALFYCYKYKLLLCFKQLSPYCLKTIYSYTIITVSGMVDLFREQQYLCTEQLKFFIHWNLVMESTWELLVKCTSIGLRLLLPYEGEGILWWKDLRRVEQEMIPEVVIYVDHPSR